MATLEVHHLRVADELVSYYRDYPEAQVSTEIIHSALCESFNQHGMTEIYNDIILSPGENKTATQLSAYFDSITFVYLTEFFRQDDSGISNIHLVQMVAPDSVVLIQRLQ